MRLSLILAALFLCAASGFAQDASKIEKIDLMGRICTVSKNCPNSFSSSGLEN